MKVERIRNSIQVTSSGSDGRADTQGVKSGSGDGVTISDKPDGERKKHFYRAPVYTKQSIVAAEEPTTVETSPDDLTRVSAQEPHIDVTA